MKKLLLAALTSFISTVSYSQILAPVKWSYGAKKISNEQAIVFIKATIDKGWHIYSQHVADGGPVKTSFRFNNSDDYTLNGITIEPKAISKYEKAFSMNVQYFEQSVIFQQKVKLKNGRQQLAVPLIIWYAVISSACHPRMLNLASR
jgi:hypothetical protein